MDSVANRPGSPFQSPGRANEPQGGTMNRIAFSLVLALTPAALVAQTSARAQSNTKADAEVKTSAAQASASTSVDAEIAVARERGLPTQPIRRRAAEARAKGKTEAQAAMAAGRVR